MAQTFASFAEFYPYYLSEHADIRCRRLHFAGTTVALISLIAAIVTGNGWWLLAALLAGYSFAWVGHFYFEKNRPATFKHPFYSFIGDWVMYADIWRGRVSV
jgi:hypothetical protein